MFGGGDLPSLFRVVLLSLLVLAGGAVFFRHTLWMVLSLLGG